MTHLNFILLMQQQGEGGGSPYSTLIMMGVIVVVFYFFMIRPQIKRQKETKKFREDMKEGDDVMTTGGIYGKILSVKEDSIVLEVEGKSKLRVSKSAVIKDESGIPAQK
ncbi:MAG: preprotein translocase subunit YajC [Bacteroidota bacterium]|nr:preprotein translocase subunit YajC [Bacteroidota bacterium]